MHICSTKLRVEINEMSGGTTFSNDYGVYPALPFQPKVYQTESLPACADGREVSKDISKIVDIQFS